MSHAAKIKPVHIEKNYLIKDENCLIKLYIYSLHIYIIKEVRVRIVRAHVERNLELKNINLVYRSSTSITEAGKKILDRDFRRLLVWLFSFTISP